MRVPGLNRGPWFDEIVTLVTSVRQPLAELVADFASKVKPEDPALIAALEKALAP